MTGTASNTAIETRALALALAVNTFRFADEDTHFRRYAARQRPGLRRKLLSLAAACRRLHQLRPLTYQPLAA